MIALVLCWSLGQPPEPAGEVREPEQVQAEAELSEQVTTERVRTPEQVRDDPAALPSADPSTPRAVPPNPSARPSEGVYAVGSGPLAPLPAPPPAVPAQAIPKLDWRGRLWLALRVGVTGPLAGQGPAKPAVVGVGATVEGGWRINQLAAIGTSIGRHPHELIRTEVLEGLYLQRGWLTSWDVVVVRLFAPVRGRVDPFVDLGGGVVFVESALEGRPLAIGGSTRASVGFDAWLTKHLSLGLGLLHRASFVEGSVGHSLQGLIDISGHW